MSDIPKIIGINHVGLAPKDPAKAKWFFETVLNIPFLGSELVKEQKTNTHMFESSVLTSSQASLPRLEVLQSESDDGPIARFLQKKGSGIHHLALTVENVEEAIKHMKNHDIRLIDESPRNGAHNTRIAFIHPSSTGGLLIELVEQL